MSIPTIDIPAEAPVMILPSALLFPGALMPLYIFELRYRAMLEWALSHERMFCVALMRKGITEAVNLDDFYHTCGLGLVRACVTGKDGTSNLMLQGLSRVRLTGFVQNEPFRIARLALVPTEKSAKAQIAPLVAEIHALCKRFRSQGMTKSIEAFLLKMKDYDALADAVSHSLVQDPERRQEILEEPRLRERLRLIIKHIHEEGPDPLSPM